MNTRTHLSTRGRMRFSKKGSSRCSGCDNKPPLECTSLLLISSLNRLPTFARHLEKKSASRSPRPSDTPIVGARLISVDVFHPGSRTSAARSHLRQPSCAIGSRLKYVLVFFPPGGSRDISGKPCPTWTKLTNLTVTLNIKDFGDGATTEFQSGGYRSYAAFTPKALRISRPWVESQRTDANGAANDAKRAKRKKTDSSLNIGGWHKWQLLPQR